MKINFNLKLLISGTFLSILIMSYTGRPLKQSHSGFKSILSLEFGNTSAQVDTIINTWQSESYLGKTLLRYARFNTYWDFLFIFFYSVTLFFAHQALQVSGNKTLRLLYTLLGAAALLAGVLDSIENTGMLRSMNHINTDRNAWMTAGCAKVKFILVGLSVSVLLIRWIMVKNRKVME